MNACDYTLLGICLTRAPADSGFAIFGFSEFLTSLALLVLVFNSSDYRYQFRVSIAPIPLVRLSFSAAVVTGAGTLLADLWFAGRWYSLPWGVSRAIIQGIFGALFLSTVLLWIWFAYVAPPIFNRWNYKRYYKALFHAVVRGSDAQLAILAGELVRSSESLVRLSRPRRWAKETKIAPNASEYAHDALRLLANRKLCRHIVSSSPVTSIALMQEAARQEKFAIPLGAFARLITTEAILNRDSILYHEDTYGADVLGWVQPFSNAIYGNYRLVEGISVPMESPLDLDWRVAWAMDGVQFEAYCRITLNTFKDYIETGAYTTASSVISRAFDIIEGAGRELYQLDSQSVDTSDRESSKRFEAAVQFVDEMIDFLGEQKDLVFGTLRVDPLKRVGFQASIFDKIADMMYKLTLSASAVRSPPNNAWWVQYNIFWSKLFTFREPSEAWGVIRFKYARIVFDEIKRLKDFPNFEGARILGICLNVMGLSETPVGQRDRGEYALRKAILRWTKSNYVQLVKDYPPVAEHCLLGSITFDAEKKRLVKTFSQGLRLEPSRSYLALSVPPSRKRRSTQARARSANG